MRNEALNASSAKFKSRLWVDSDSSRHIWLSICSRTKYAIMKKIEGDAILSRSFCRNEQVCQGGHAYLFRIVWF